MAITASEFKSFAITQHKGFRLSFENGWGVSVFSDETEEQAREAVRAVLGE